MVIVCGNTFQLDMPALNELNESGMAQRVCRSGSPAQYVRTHHRTLADDGNILYSNSMNEADVARDPFSFPAHLSDGVIMSIRRADQGCSLFDVQHQVRPQCDRSGQIPSCWKDDATATQDGTPIDRLLNCRGVLRNSVASRTEGANIHHQWTGRFDRSNGTVQRRCRFSGIRKYPSCRRKYKG